MESRTRASPEQFAALLEFMERHGDISRPQQGPQGRLKADRLWQELEEILNSMGGGVIRPLIKWKKAAPSEGNSLPPPTRDTVSPLPQYQISNADEIMLEFIPSQPVQATTASTASSMPPFSGELQTNMQTPVQMFAPMPSAASPTASTSRGVPQRQRRHRESPSPVVTPTTSTPRRRRLHQARSRRIQTPFERATSEFVAVEHRRLQLEADRDKKYHEREVERLRLEAKRLEIESRRIEVEEQKNQILNRLGVAVDNLIEMIPQFIQSSLPSTDIIP